MLYADRDDPHDLPLCRYCSGGPRRSTDSAVHRCARRRRGGQYLARQISLAQTGVAAAGRLADPEISIDFGEKRTDSPLTGQRLGDGPAFAVSILQPIEFNGRIPLRKAIAQGNVTLARLGLAQFDATLAGRARSLGYRLFAAGERAAAAAAVAGRMRSLAAVLVAPSSCKNVIAIAASRFVTVCWGC